jgi:hypothetical protein
MPRYIIINLKETKDKDSIWKVAKENTFPMVQITADFLSEAMNARRKWHSIFKVLNDEFRILYSAKYNL